MCTGKDLFLKQQHATADPAESWRRKMEGGSLTWLAALAFKKRHCLGWFKKNMTSVFLALCFFPWKGAGPSKNCIPLWQCESLT